MEMRKLWNGNRRKILVCWNCGLRRSRTASNNETIKEKERSVPSLESVEPPKRKTTNRDIGLSHIAYVLGSTMGVALLKPLLNFIFGDYSLYIFLPIIFIVAAVIFWKYFHRDQNEGVGINLH